jgi:OPT family oligopeptide transporter
MDPPEQKPQTEAQTEKKKLTPEEIELNWYRNVYQGDSMPQLTWRAIIMGACLGMFMSLSNLYVGLKTGWSLGVAITACIMSFAIQKVLVHLFPGIFQTEMSILENNCMQSTASSAGSSTGGTMVSAISAYLIITGHHMHWVVLTLWTIFLASLGVFMAIPMKRQMINIEQLPFPSGIAAATTLRSLHAKGRDAILKARALFCGGVFGAGLAWMRDAGNLAVIHIKSELDLPFMLSGFPLAKWSVYFDMSAIMVAAGAIMGFRITWSMLLGACINYLFLAPKALAAGAIDPAHMGFSAIMRWSVWGGASMMVTSSLFAFAMQWKTVVRAFSGLTAIFTGKKVDENDPLARIEVPGSWFMTGVLVSGLGCATVLYFAFGTSIIMGVVSVALTFMLAIVACRATGESDITPIGAMGKITQLAYGILVPTNMVTNLMTASVTAGAAGSSADLLTDLKSGYLLGANPRKQFLAQFAGIFAGTLIVVPAFYILVPDASVLGTDKWPAPAAEVWAAVARLLSNGVSSLHPMARMALLVGGIVGLILPAIDMCLPEKARKFFPSAMGLGLSMVIPFYNSLSMFLGAVLAIFITKMNKKVGDDYIIPVSAGIIAGESILGIVIALLAAQGIIH